MKNQDFLITKIVNRKNRRILNKIGNDLCEICKEENFLVQHHILGRKIKNSNKKNNLINICSNCHVKIHKGEIIIEKRVLTNYGYVLIWHKKGEESITGDDSIPYLY